jgi:PAS domain S-box-containing protein
MASDLTLTPAEEKWIKKNQVVTFVGDPSYAPFEYRDEKGNPQGITADYLEYLETETGLKFKYLPSQNWTETLVFMRQGRADVTLAMMKTRERAKFLKFTIPYLEYSDKILVREGVEGHNSLASLSGKVVAVGEEWAIVDFLRSSYPDIKLKLVPDVKTALVETSLGAADATVLGLALASYWIEKAHISNLRMSGDTGFTYSLSIAVRSDWPELVSILNKALAAMTQEEKDSLMSKWISTRVVAWRPGKVFWLSLGLVALLVISLGSILWNWSLRKKVNQRTARIEEELLLRIRAEKALRQSEARFRAFTEHSSDLVGIIGAEGIFVYMSPSARHYGYDPKILIGKKTTEILHPDDYEAMKPILAEARQKPGEIVELPDIRVLKYDGSWFVCKGVICDLSHVSGVEGMVFTGRDITKRRLVEKEKEELIRELKDALVNVKTLSGLLPICAACKKIRDDKGYWNRIEEYLADHSEAELTHSLCPECAEELYPQMSKEKEK